MARRPRKTPRAEPAPGETTRSGLGSLEARRGRSTKRETTYFFIVVPPIESYEPRSWRIGFQEPLDGRAIWQLTMTEATAESAGPEFESPAAHQNSLCPPRISSN